MYNIYISYPYNMPTVLSKVTDVFKDYNVSIKYNKFHDDYHPEYLDTSDIVIFKLMKSNLIGSNVSEECVTDKEFINFNDTY